MLPDKDRRRIKETEPPEDNIHEDVIREAEPEIDPDFIKEVEQLYERLDSLDYYSFLGIEKQAALGSIKKAYYKAAKEFHPDRHLHLPSDTLKIKLNAIFSHLTVVYKILIDSKTRMQYDRSLSVKPAGLQNSSTRMSNAKLARARFQEGKEAFRQESYSEAEELFGQAIYLDSSVPAYYFHLGLTFEKQNKFREAGKIMDQALKLDPGNPDYLAELGHVYLKLGFKLRAKSTFEKAIKSDPSNNRAAEGMQRIGNHLG